MDTLYATPEDILLNDEAEEIEDASEDILLSDGNDIDIIDDGETEDEYYDVDEDLEDYTDNDYVEVNDVDLIDNGDTEDEDDEEEEELSDEDHIAEIEDVIDDEDLEENNDEFDVDDF